MNEYKLICNVAHLSVFLSDFICGWQHHCRNCGKALCAKCASNTMAIPNIGHECLVRVCDDCRLRLDDEQWASVLTNYCVSFLLKHGRIGQ